MWDGSVINERHMNQLSSCAMTYRYIYLHAIILYYTSLSAVVSIHVNSYVTLTEDTHT